jgi:hypothetical protein
MANNDGFTSPSVPVPATKMILILNMRIHNADEVISETYWDNFRLAQNLAFSMLAIFPPLYLTSET